MTAGYDVPVDGLVALPTLRARKGTVVGAGWFSFLAVLLCAIAPLLLLRSTPLGEKYPFLHSDAWKIALLVCIATGLRFSWVVATKPQRFFETIFWLFTYVFLGLAPMLQMRSGRYPETIPVLDTSLNTQTVGVVVAGALAFSVGLVVAGNGDRTKPWARARLIKRPYRMPVSAPHRLLILCTVSLLFSAFYAFKIGGPSVLFGPRNVRSNIEGNIFPQTINAIVKASATFPLIICFTGLLRLRLDRKAQGLRGPIVLPILVFLMLAAIVNPISSPRYYAGTALLSVFAGMGAIRTAKRARIFALLIAFGLVLGFPYASAARTSQTTTLADRGGPATVLTSADFDAFDQLNNAIAYTNAIGDQNGNQLSGALLFFVPRAIWESKPEDTGPLLAEFRQYNTTNLSSPLFAELYVDGGLGWVILGMMLFGFAIRKLDIKSSLDNVYGNSSLAVVLPFYMIIILRGSLLQAMAGLAVLVVTGLFVGGRRPVPASGQVEG